MPASADILSPNLLQDTYFIFAIFLWASQLMKCLPLRQVATQPLDLNTIYQGIQSGIQPVVFFLFPSFVRNHTANHDLFVH